MKSMILIAIVATSMSACNPNPPPVQPVTPDADCDSGALQAKPCPPCICASDAGPIVVVDAGSSPEAKACNNLASIGCSDGTKSDCVTTLQKVESSPIFKIDVPALTIAKTITQAQKAGAACK
jgi:hypothetical protein